MVDKEALGEAKKRRAAFNFSLVDLSRERFFNRCLMTPLLARLKPTDDRISRERRKPLVISADSRT